jgi:rare lipoprotein A
MLFLRLLAALSAAALAVGVAQAEPAETAPGQHAQHRASNGKKLDRTGQRRVGKASIYARKFTGRTMADGTKMQPHDDNAASKTLPLGTKARVTNLETGKSAEVTIQDRGPHVPGRIVDLSPATAARIGLSRKDGVAPVEVAPIEVPLADGSVRPGAGAR